MYQSIKLTGPDSLCASALEKVEGRETILPQVTHLSLIGDRLFSETEGVE